MVISLSNPGLGGLPFATPTLWGAFQYLGAGESAPAHRHTPGAIRFVIEGEGAWTTVDGDACDMTPGASGGGWVIKRPYRHHFRHYLASVTSYGYVFDPGFLYGPYQGGVARALYNSAGG